MNKKLSISIFSGLLVVFLIYRFYVTKDQLQYFHLQGQTMGTITYNVKYAGETSFQSEIDTLLVAYNQALSTYIPDSEISILNKKGNIDNPGRLMVEVMTLSREVYEMTDGAFDPTVGPVVNVWGFGPDKEVPMPDSAQIKTLNALVGFDQVLFSTDKIQLDSGMYIDFSAIAKGHAVDEIARFLSSQNVQDFMVEIGGEVVAKGKNDRGEFWKIGVEDPLVSADERKLLAIATLENQGMATSGNYRNYYEKDGRLIAHTIDPRTGYNTNHQLLSATVFATSCTLADAYATAFMVMGSEAAKDIILNSTLEAFLISQNANGELEFYISPGMKDQLEIISEN